MTTEKAKMTEDSYDVLEYVVLRVKGKMKGMGERRWNGTLSGWGACNNVANEWKRQELLLWNVGTTEQAGLSV